MDPFVLIILLSFLPYIIMFIIYIFMAWWVHNDAKKEGMEALLWALITFFVGFIGLIIYLVMRGEHRKTRMYGMPVGYYPPPGYMPPPYYVPPPAQGAPPSQGPIDFICPKCGHGISNPYHSKSLYCDNCGSTHQIR